MARQAVRSAKSRHTDMVLATDAPPLDTSKLRYDYSQVAEEVRQEVIEAAVDILANGNRAKQSIIAMGQRLIEVKALLPEGTFTRWISTEFELSDRMAQNFMNVARQYGERPEIVSVLNDTVLYLLAAPSTPQSARDEIEALAVSKGKSPRVAITQRVIKAHRPPPTPPTPPPAKVFYLEPEERLEPSKAHEVAYAVEAPSEYPKTTYSAGLETPEDLRERGVIIEEYEPNYFRWRGVSAPSEGLIGAGCDSAAQAIEQGRMCFRIAAPPTLPDDLASAGFRLVKVSDKMWAVERDEDPEPYQSNWCYDPADCARDVRRMLSGNREMVGDAWISKALTEGNPANVAFMSAVNMATEAELRSAQFQTNAEDPHDDARAVAIGKRLEALGVVGSSTPSATQPDPRLDLSQRLRRLLDLTREAVNLEYAQLTGRFTDIPPLERSLETMIAHLDSLIAALSSDGAGGADAG